MPCTVPKIVPTAARPGHACADERQQPEYQHRQASVSHQQQYHDADDVDAAEPLRLPLRALLHEHRERPWTARPRAGGCRWCVQPRTRAAARRRPCVAPGGRIQRHASRQRAVPLCQRSQTRRRKGVAVAVPAATSRRVSAARVSDPEATRAPGAPLLEMRGHVHAPRAAIGGNRHPAPSDPASATADIDMPAANPGPRPGSIRRSQPGETRRLERSAKASAREVSAAACGSGPEIASSNIREAGPSPISSRMSRS